jgi:hypothetical protein
MGSYSYSFGWPDGDDNWLEPTALPTVKPVAPSPAPSPAPTSKPTAKPSARPSAKPTTPAPTARPSLDWGDDDHFGMGSYSYSFGWPDGDDNWLEPTGAPVAKLTPAPSPAPTAKPTSKPTAAPTSKLTLAPTPEPSAKPSSRPSDKPTLAPTIDWSSTDDAFSFSYSYVYGGGDDDWTGTTCACSAFYNGADAEDEFLCVKKSNGVCRPPNGGDGLCPGDHDMCSNKHKG